MNERIRQLLAKCTQESVDGPCANPYVDQEKFAESIIQECIEILHNLGTEYIDAGQAQVVDNSNQHKALAIAKARITAHFKG